MDVTLSYEAMSVQLIKSKSRSSIFGNIRFTTAKPYIIHVEYCLLLMRKIDFYVQKLIYKLRIISCNIFVELQC